MHTLTITADDGRTWSSVLRPEELAALIAEAERVAAAERAPVTPADVAAVAIARALQAAG